MKKIMALILALCMVFSLCACGGSDAADSGEKVVKIGVFEPSSGDSASGGKKEILGMQYANALTPEITIGGETYKVELVYGDNGSSTDKAPSAASDLVSAEVSVVLGSYGSGVSMAGGPKFEEAGIPAIGVTCTNPQVTADCDVYFRLAFLDPFQGTVLANYAYNELGVTTAYTLAMLGSDYDQGLVHYFTEAFKALGGDSYGLTIGSQAILIGLCYANGLSPITGKYGIVHGIVAGGIHYLLVTAVPDMHGGFCLYNGGLTAALICLLLVPQLERFCKTKDEKKAIQKQ